MDRVVRERKRGLTEKIRALFNPMPEVTEQELLDRAGLKYMEATKADPFEFRLQWSGGLEREVIWLKAGEFVQLRESEVKPFLDDFAEMGLVVVDDLHDDAEVRTAAISGLRKAIAYWRMRGQDRLAEFRRDSGIAADQWEDYKGRYWPYYVNAARAEVCKEHLDKILDEARPATASKAKKAS